MRTSLAQPDSCDVFQFDAALFLSFGRCAPLHARLLVLGSKQPMSQLSSTRTSRPDRFGEFSRYSRPLKLDFVVAEVQLLDVGQRRRICESLDVFGRHVRFDETELVQHCALVRRQEDLDKRDREVLFADADDADPVARLFCVLESLVLCEFDAVAAFVLDGVVFVGLDDVVSLEVVLEVFVTKVVRVVSRVGPRSAGSVRMRSGVVINIVNIVVFVINSVALVNLCLSMR